MARAPSAPTAPRSRGSVVVAACSFVLALGALGPLLGDGWVLLLDYADYPVGPHPDIGRSAWGFPPGLTSRIPLKGLLLVVFDRVPWEQAGLLPFVLAPPLAAWGFWRVFRGDVLASVIATLAFIVNPFMYTRIAAGQAYLVLGFALLPRLLAVLAQGGRARWRLSVAGGMLIALVAALAVHFVFIAGLLLVAAAASAVAHGARRRALLIFGCGIVAAILSVYWLVPLAGTAANLQRVTSADLEAFATAPDARYGLLLNVLGLYGFWHAGIPLPKQVLEPWPLLLIAMAGIMSVGVRALWKGANSEVALTLIVAAAAGAILAMGHRAPFAGPMFEWSFEHVPFFRVMREPQKFAILLVLAYAVFYATGARTLTRALVSSAAKSLALALLLALPCVYAYKMFWAFNDYVRPSVVPESWDQADRVMGEGLEKVLVLPWHLFVAYPWTQDRNVPTPAPGWFRREVVVAEDPEFRGVAAQSTSPRSEYLEYLYRRGGDIREFGNLVAPLGIKYVVLSKTADWRRYGWLFRQRDLRMIARWPGLVVFENLRPVAAAYAVRRTLMARDWGEVVELARDVPLHAYQVTLGRAGDAAGDAGRRAASIATATIRHDPARYEIKVRGARRLTLAEPFDDAWRADGVESVANLGVTNAFAVDALGSPIAVTYSRWPLTRAAYAAGAAVWGVTIGAVGLARLRDRRVRASSSDEAR